MKFNCFLSITVVLFFGYTCQIKSQTYQEISGRNTFNVITTAVPFLLISPDARSGAMGDVGVSSNPDIFSMHHNPAKYAFIREIIEPSEDSLILEGNYKLKQGETKMGLSYSPWLKNLSSKSNFGYLAFSKPINLKSTFASTLRYLSFGDIQFTNDQGGDEGTYSPNEWSIDACLAQKLSKNLSGAVAARFIYSNLTLGQNVGGASTSVGKSIAVDVSLYWEKEVNWFRSLDSKFAWGVNISNIGTKLGYSSASIKKDFIPANLRFGPTLKIAIDKYNTIAFSIDVNKLLVATPPIYKRDSITGNPIPLPGSDKYEILKGMDDDVSVVAGILQSFYDSPGGFEEEMRELAVSFGAEYWYDKVFALRCGAFYEDKSKGNRKFFTAGAGYRYKAVGLDLSYFMAIDSRYNALQNTLRFSLYLNLIGKQKTTQDN